MPPLTAARRTTTTVKLMSSALFLALYRAVSRGELRLWAGAAATARVGSGGGSVECMGVVAGNDGGASVATTSPVSVMRIGCEAGCAKEAAAGEYPGGRIAGTATTGESAGRGLAYSVPVLPKHMGHEAGIGSGRSYWQ